MLANAKALMRMPLLITGFSSFPGAPRNPTEDMVETLQDHPAHGRSFRAVTLPVAWEGSFSTLREAIESAGPKTVLLFGLHRRTERLRIEMLARNRRELGRADALGAFPSGPAVLDGPQSLPCSLPWTDIARAFRGVKVPFEWSTDAGGYLCNDTLYRLAHAAERLGVERFGFFHVPLSDERVDDVAASEKMPEVFCSLPAAVLAAAALALVDALSTAMVA